MFITADQILCHLVGDYCLQSDWQALVKTQSSKPAFWHALTYTLCFLFLTRSPLALAFIFVTHFVIDRWRLARYVCWAKNFLAPKWIDMYRKGWVCGICAGKSFSDSSSSKWIAPCPKCQDSSKMLCVSEETFKVRNYPWAECVGTGYHKDRPPFLAVWLVIVCDNTLHIFFNGIALHWF
jgi:hypothetical protein